jgi:hypothetical protein
VAKELETGVIQQVLDIPLGTSEQVVGTYDLVATGEQTINQMRTDKTRPTRNQNALSKIIGSH